MRPRHCRDRLFAQFEWLAVKIAGDLWARWGLALGEHGVSWDDLRQEASIALLKTVEMLDLKRAVRFRRAYVSKCVRLRLTKIVHARVYPRLVEVQADLSSTSPEPEVKSEDFLRIGITLREKDARFCEMLLAGFSVQDARRAVGWNRAQYEVAKVRLAEALGHGRAGKREAD